MRLKIGKPRINPDWTCTNLIFGSTRVEVVLNLANVVFHYLSENLRSIHLEFIFNLRFHECSERFVDFHCFVEFKFLITFTAVFLEGNTNLFVTDKFNFNVYQVDRRLLVGRGFSNWLKRGVFFCLCALFSSFAIGSTHQGVRLRVD